MHRRREANLGMYKRVKVLLAQVLTVILCLNSTVGSAAGVLKLPSALKVVEDEAFYGAQMIDEVVMPEGAERIGSKAFADSTLKAINLPDSIQNIADDAFDGCDPLTVTVESGSYAHTYAQGKGIDFVLAGEESGELRITSVLADKTQAAVGDIVTWTAEAAGGTEPYRYYYELYYEGMKIDTRAYSTDAAYAFEMTDAGTYYVIAKVRDADYTVVQMQSENLSVSAEGALVQITGVIPDQQQVTTGDTVTWTVTAEGGMQPYRYAYTLLRGEETIASQNYGEENTFSYALDTEGEYQLLVRVADANNNQTELQGGAVIANLPQLTLTAPVADMEQAVTDDTVTWTVYAEGGLAPYTYAFTLTLGGETVASADALTEGLFSYTFTQPGSYVLSASVTDAKGNTVTTQSGYTVALRALNVLSLTADLSAPLTGDTITWTAEAEGGVEPYQYAFSIFAGEEEMDFRAYAQENTFAYTPEDPGEYSVQVMVRDSAGTTASMMSDVLSVALRPLSITAVTADTDMLKLGDAITWTTEAVGGVSPLRYAFDVYKDGEVITTRAYGLLPTYAYTPQASGSYHVTAYVRDTEMTVVQTDSAAVTVYDPLALSAITPDLTSVLTGEAVTWTVEGIGGKNTITYDYEVYWGETLEFVSRKTVPTLTYAPMREGTYTVKVTATDEGGDISEISGGAVEVSLHGSSPAEDFTYTVLNGTYCSVTGYTGTDTAVVIPEMLDEYIVQTIGNGMFKNNTTIRSVVIPDTIETMGSDVFSGCTNLLSVVGGAKLTNIGNYAFYNCISLNSYSFCSATASIGSYAFVGTTLRHFEGWDGLNKIHYRAFRNCTSLESVHLPDSITTMYAEVFSGCSKLSSVNYPMGWTSKPTDYAYDSPFADCASLKSIVVPEGITAIPAYAFYEASSLTSIDLPSTLKSIGERAFYNCSGLRSVEIPESVTSIGTYAFYGCAGLTSLELPDSVISLGNNAFDTCTGLTGVKLSNGLTSLPNSAFEECTGLKSVVLPDGLKTIHYRAFRNCTSLESVHLPDGITTMYAEVFSGCSKLSSVNYPMGWTSKPTDYAYDSPFADCASLKSIVVPAGVTAIPAYAFYEASNLTSITIPETVTFVGSNAFYNCTNLSIYGVSGSYAETYAIANSIPFNPAPVPEVTLTVEATGDTVGSSIHAVASAANAAAPYAYRFSLYQDGVLIRQTDYNEESERDFTIYETGTYQVVADAKDRIGLIGTAYGGTMSFGEPTYAAVSGQVLSGEEGIQGISVSLYDNTADHAVQSVRTLTDGVWAMSSIEQGHSYTVSYSSNTYALTPDTHTFEASQSAIELGNVQAVFNGTASGEAMVTASTDVTTVETGVPVIYSIEVTHADQVRLIVDGVVYETYPCDEHGGLVQRAFTKAGERSVVFQAGYDGVWGGFSDTLPLTVTNSKGTLEKPAIHAETFYKMGEDVTLAWDQVEHAEQYSVYLFVNGTNIYHTVVEEEAIRIPDSRLQIVGEYAVEIIATATGYTQSSGTASFNLIDTALSVSVSGEVFVVGETTEIVIAAPDADYITYTITAPDQKVIQEKTVWNDQKSIQLPLTDEGTYLVSVSAGRNSESDAYAEEVVELHVYRDLQLSQYSWSPSSVSDTLAVEVATGGDWQISAFSDWLIAEREENTLHISIDTDSLAGKTGYVEVVCGETTARVQVNGTAFETELIITNPVDTVIVNRPFIIQWDPVDGAVSYTVMLQDKTVMNTLIVREDVPQELGQYVADAFLLDGHQYEVTVIAYLSDDKTNASMRLSAKTEFTVSTASVADVCGTVTNEDSIPMEGVTVSVYASDCYIDSTETAADGTWSFNGLTPGNTYQFLAQAGDFVSQTIVATVTEGNNSIDVLVCSLDLEVESYEIVLDTEQTEPYIETLSQSDPVTAESSQAWLTAELADINGFTELKLTPQEWPQEDTSKQRSAIVTVTYADGSAEVYTVIQNSPITAIYTQYLDGENVTDGETALFEKKFGKPYMSTGSGVIESYLVKKGNTLIQAGHTIEISGQRNALRIEGDLVIEGKLILKDSARLNVYGDLTISGNGELIVKDYSGSVDGTLYVKNNGKLSVEGGEFYVDAVNLDSSASASVASGSFSVHGELKLTSTSAFHISGGETHVWGKMKVLDTSRVTMTGGTMDVFDDLVFKTKSSQTDLAAGTIIARKNANLSGGYIAKQNHILEMAYQKRDFWDWKKTITLKEGCGQKIGYLSVVDPASYHINVSSEDYYDSNLIIDTEIVIDVDTLKEGMTYSDGILKYFTVKPYSHMGSQIKELDNKVQTAIVMGYLHAISSGHSTNIWGTAFNVPAMSDNRYVEVSYVDENSIKHIGFTIEYVIGVKTENKDEEMTGMTGTAWIDYNGYKYTINPPTVDAQMKLVNKMMAVLKMDAAKLMKSSLSVLASKASIKDALGKNGIIEGIKTTCEYVGIDLGSADILIELKEAMDAEEEKDFLKSIAKMLKVAIQAK